MANTLIPIQTFTLTSTAANVTFSNIPQNYTDLKLVISARDSSSTGGNWNGYSMTIYPNGSGSNITQRSLFGNGSGTNTYSDSQMYTPVVMSADTAGVFGNTEVFIANYSSSVNKSFTIDSVGETNASASAQRIAAGVWAQTSAITSLQINAYSTFTVGSTFTLYGISNGVKAIGGTLTVAGGYAYHTFTSTGSFLPNQQIKGAEVLIVAGGGGGGYNAGGGGGAGGFRYINGISLTAGLTYIPLIGSGGAGSTTNNNSVAASGTTSVFSTFSTSGGGGAGSLYAFGSTGGSGGGGGKWIATGTTAGNSGGYNPPEGYQSGSASGSSLNGAPGGGGAGGAGGNGTANGGAGGLGSTSLSSWLNATGTGVSGSIAGGGGGGSDNTGGSASGGGGAGGSTNANGTSGSANTGGGAGGGGSGGAAGSGGNGGSGVIIVRYPLN